MELGYNTSAAAADYYKDGKQDLIINSFKAEGLLSNSVV